MQFRVDSVPPSSIAFLMPRFVFHVSCIALAVLGMGVCPLIAHPADESAMRVRTEPHKLEVRFTFNILTLTRLVKVDADGDGRIGISELDAAQAGVAFYLNQHVPIEINQKKAVLGADVEFEYLWPEARATPPMTDAEYSGRNVDVTFVLPIEDRVLADVWIGFEIFEQTGPMQLIHGTFEQDGQVTAVEFKADEPEYTYDTGYAEDPFVQEAEKKRKAELAAPAPMEAGGSNQRWWMVRVVVLILVIVVGRHATLARRAKKMPTRRGRRS